MKSIFLSYHFDPQVKLLAGLVEDMIKSHDIDVVTGKHLGGAELNNEIKARIRSCSGLIYILTKREEGKTNQWITSEITIADTLQIPFIGIIEVGIPVPGPFIAREHIMHTSADEANLWLKLSATIGKWKADSGRVIEAYLEPPDVVALIRDNFDFIKVKYRLYDADYKYTDWREDAPLKRTPSGVMMKIPGVKKDSEIEI